MPKRTSKENPVGNTNTIIIGKTAIERLGSLAGIFDELPIPEEYSNKKFSSPADFYMWKHGWHTLESFKQAYRNLRAFLGPNTYFIGGSGLARHKPSKLIDDTKYTMKGIANAMLQLPDYNEMFNDVKDFIMIDIPRYHKDAKKIRSRFIIRFHDDQDPHDDYISDPHIQGILTATPQVFGNSQALVSQPLLPYDLERLCEIEPEFIELDLDPHVESDRLYIRDPLTKSKRLLGKRVVLISENVDIGKVEKELMEQKLKPEQIGRILKQYDYLCGQPVFLGRFQEFDPNQRSDYTGFLIEGDLSCKGITYFPDKTIIGAPYHAVTFECDREGRSIGSLYYAMKFKLQKPIAVKISLDDALRQLALENREKSKALVKERHLRIHLEEIVEDRTAELREANENLKAAFKETKRLQGMIIRSEVSKAKIEQDMQTARELIGALAHEGGNRVYPGYSRTSNLLQLFDTTEIQNISVINDALIGITRFLGEKKKSEIISQDEFNDCGRQIVAIHSFLTKYQKMIAACTATQDGLEVIKESFRSFFELKDSFLNYARLGKIERGNQEINLSEVMRSVNDKYKFLFNEHYISYNTEIQDDIHVVGDKSHLETIIFNIVTNAIDAIKALRHSQSHPLEIHLDLFTYKSNSDAYAKITLYDSGIGMSDEILHQLFTPFVTFKENGTGLGLTMVRRVVDAYEGKIQVCSNSGKGTEFSIDIKLEPSIYNQKKLSSTVDV